MELTENLMDNGRTIVVMDTKKYTSQMEAMLADTNTYEIAIKEKSHGAKEENTERPAKTTTGDQENNTGSIRSPHTHSKHHTPNIWYAKNS